MEKNIKLIRLINREEIIAEVILEGVINVLVRNPLNVIIIPSKVETGDTRVGLAPWANFSDEEEFSINTSCIVSIMKPIAQLKEQYNQTFSKIITPKTELIIPN